MHNTSGKQRRILRALLNINKSKVFINELMEFDPLISTSASHVRHELLKLVGRRLVTLEAEGEHGRRYSITLNGMAAAVRDVIEKAKVDSGWNKPALIAYEPGYHSPAPGRVRPEDVRLSDKDWSYI